MVLLIVGACSGPTTRLHAPTTRLNAPTSTVPPTPKNVTTISLPGRWWFNQITRGAQGPVLAGTRAGDLDQKQCVLGGLSPKTLLLAVSPTSCNNPGLQGQSVAPVVAYVPGSNNATVKIAHVESPTGQLSLGPVVMTFGNYSDTKLIWTYGPGSLWIYDVATTAGPEVLDVSDTTGQVASVTVMPKLYRPLLTANVDGLWLGSSIGGADGMDALYHVAPGSHTAMSVLPGNTEHVFWMAGDGHHLWAGIGPIYSNQTFWRFDGPDARPLFHVPDEGFRPSAVVGDATAGLWTVEPFPPLGSKIPSAPYPNQDVVRIDPNTGAEHVVATLKGIPIPISLSGGTTKNQMAYFGGSLFVLEPPFLASNGYMGFSKLIRVIAAGTGTGM